MKKYFLVTIFLITLLPFVSATKEDFDKAESLYKKQQYDGALRIYESLLGEDKISPTIFYNMGNCYFKKGDYLNALLYFEKADKYQPGMEDVQMNLEITRSRITEKSDELSAGVSGWFYAVVNSREADYWTYLALGLSLLGTIMLFLMYFSLKLSMKQICLATGVISFVFAIVFSVFSWYQISFFNSDDSAIIGEENIEVKSEPADNSKTILLVPGGMKVKILSEQEDWSEISLNSHVGWVKTAVLKNI